MKFSHLALISILISSVAMASAEERTEKDWVQLMASCLLENAPENWNSVSVTYERKGADENGLNQVSVSHKVVSGMPESAPQELTPCRPLIPAQIIEQMSSLLPEGSRHWKEASLTIFKTGRYKLKYVQP